MYLDPKSCAAVSAAAAVDAVVVAEREKSRCAAREHLLICENDLRPQSFFNIETQKRQYHIIRYTAHVFVTGRVYIKKNDTSVFYDISFFNNPKHLWVVNHKLCNQSRGGM